MAIITIFSGTYCKGNEIARKTAESLNYQRIETRLLEETSRKFRINKDKLTRSMTGPLPVFNRFTHEREKNIACLKVVLTGLIQADNQLLYGYAGHLLPRNIPHVLKVCVIANFDHRIKQVMETGGKSEKEAQKIIHNDDKERSQWTQYLFDKLPYDESLYDMIIPMHDMSVGKAVDTICTQAKSDAVQTTPEARLAAEDFMIAASVNLALVDAGHDVDVAAERGKVTITINNYVVRLEKYKDELKRIAAGVNGVEDVGTRIGPDFSPPPILPMGDLALPSKILLVDDEKEFVHTLSERLKTRDIPSSVVYDGEEALDFVEKDEPDVMVLDLKMPGIDGIEVLRRVKRDHPLVEVIILTGHGSEREETLAEQLGAFAYLHKPVNIEVLTQVMKEAYQKVNRSKEDLKSIQKSDEDDEDDDMESDE